MHLRDTKAPPARKALREVCSDRMLSRACVEERRGRRQPGAGVQGHAAAAPGLPGRTPRARPHAGGSKAGAAQGRPGSKPRCPGYLSPSVRHRHARCSPLSRGPPPALGAAPCRRGAEGTRAQAPVRPVSSRCSAETAEALGGGVLALRAGGRRRGAAQGGAGAAWARSTRRSAAARRPGAAQRRGPCRPTCRGG